MFLDNPTVDYSKSGLMNKKKNAETMISIPKSKK